LKCLPYTLFCCDFLLCLFIAVVFLLLSSCELRVTFDSDNLCDQQKTVSDDMLVLRTIMSLCVLFFANYISVRNEVVAVYMY